MMRNRWLFSLICLLCCPLWLCAQEVNEKKDSTQLDKAAVLKALMEALSNQQRDAEKTVATERVPGSVSPDFQCTDVKGKVCSLKDFKGKYVFIDVWATWCGPCCKEIPYLQQLEKKLAKKKIVFVSLSCDKDRSVWEKMVKEKKMGGVQLYMGADLAFRKAYGITAIPRFVLLDKEGKIVNATMTYPSNPETEKVLLSLKGL